MTRRNDDIKALKQFFPDRYSVWITAVYNHKPQKPMMLQDGFTTKADAEAYVKKAKAGERAVAAKMAKMNLPKGSGSVQASRYSIRKYSHARQIADGRGRY